MSETLRTRLIALAHGMAHPIRYDALAIAAAKLAFETALEECSPPAAFDGEDCEYNIRALAATLDAKPGDAV